MFLSIPNLRQLARPKLQGLFGNEPGFVPGAVPDLWVFDGPLVFTYSDGKITIPKGATTDFASVPKALDWVPFLDRQGNSRLPGALHDGIYRLGQEKGKDFADGILKAACLDLGMTTWEAQTYYLGVHWFGKSSWAFDAAMPNYGDLSAKFEFRADYDAWMASGGTIYSPSK